MTVLRLRDTELMWREVDDEVVILDLRQSVYANVNASGRTLWLQLAKGASTDELAAELERVHGREPDVAAREAQAFVDSIRAQGLLA